MQELCSRDYFRSNEELIGLQRVIIVAADKNVQLGNWWRKTIVVHCGTVAHCGTLWFIVALWRCAPSLVGSVNCHINSSLTTEVFV